MIDTAGYTLAMLAGMAVFLLIILAIPQWLDRFGDLFWMAVLRPWVFELTAATAGVAFLVTMLLTRKLALSFLIALLVSPFIARPAASWIARRKAPATMKLPKGNAVFARRKLELAQEFEAAAIEEVAAPPRPTDL